MTLQEQDSALRQLVSALQLKNVTLVDDTNYPGGKKAVEEFTLATASTPRSDVVQEISDLMDSTASDAPAGYSQKKVDMLIFALNARGNLANQSQGYPPMGMMNQEVMMLPVNGTVQAHLTTMLKDELLKIVV